MNHHRARRPLLAALMLAVVLLFSACHRQPSSRRYPFTGRVVSVDTQSQSATIDGDAVPGYMDAMAMSYPIKPAAALSQLAPGDSISGEVVVVQNAKPDNATPSYWLENIKVTGRARISASETGSAQRIPAPGDDIPDFQFTNQNGRRVSLKQYRGKVILLTFIYTRCPFPDFCPRMSSNFAEIYKQLGADPSLAARAHLLTVSFDPRHDTPKVLRDYGFSVAHTHDPALFNRWEFAVPRAEDLPKIAGSFGLIYQPDGGVITHNLSTTVIGPDGKIVRWYHGGDWQVSDLMKDVTEALGRKP
jgi:protein SCO1